MHLVPLRPDEVRKLWGTIEPYAKRLTAEYPDDYPPGQLLREIDGDILLLWLIWDEPARRCHGFVGTKVIVKPSGRRFLDIAALGGENPEQWIGLIAQLEAHAARMKCQAIALTGRLGWAKLLPGYEAKRGALLFKEIAGAEEKPDGDDRAGHVDPGALRAGATRH